MSSSSHVDSTRMARLVPAASGTGRHSSRRLRRASAPGALVSTSAGSARASAGLATSRSSRNATANAGWRARRCGHADGSVPGVISVCAIAHDSSRLTTAWCHPAGMKTSSPGRWTTSRIRTRPSAAARRSAGRWSTNQPAGPPSLCAASPSAAKSVSGAKKHQRLAPDTQTFQPHAQRVSTCSRLPVRAPPRNQCGWLDVPGTSASASPKPDGGA